MRGEEGEMMLLISLTSNYLEKTKTEVILLRLFLFFFPLKHQK